MLALLASFSLGGRLVTTGTWERHVAACMLHVYTRRPLVEWTAMRSQSYQTHVDTAEFVRNLLPWLQSYQARYTGSLEATILRAQRPATHEGVVQFLRDEMWIRLSHEVS